MLSNLINNSQLIDTTPREVEEVIQNLINTEGIYLSLDLIEYICDFEARQIDMDRTKLVQILEFLISQEVIATDGEGYGLARGMREWYYTYWFIEG